MQIETFAAKRREQLQVGDEALGPIVERAMAEVGSDGWFDPIVDAAGQIFIENYAAEAPDAAFRAPLARFKQRLGEVLDRSTASSSAERITRWVSTFAVNAGTIQGAYRRGVRYKVWVDMEDSDVRNSHRHAAGQVVPIGGAFTVAGVKVGYPGEPVGPFEIWINCRCVAQPAARSGETMSDSTLDLGSNTHTRALIATAMQETPGPDEDTPEPEQRTGALVVMLPADSDPVTAATSEDMAHMTTIWMGDTKDFTDYDEPQYMADEVAAYAAGLDGPIVVPVKERGMLGKEDADVVFLEPTESLLAARDGLLESSPWVKRAHDSVEQYPEWTPHVTLGYPEGVENGPAVGEYDGTEITFDRLGLWLGGDYTEYPMGGVVSDTITADASSNPVDDQSDLTESEIVDEPEDGEELVTEIPVHGVLAPEGVETGDGRGFRLGALSSRPITPTRGLPLRLEITGSHGGNQTSEVVTVGRIDEIFRHDETNTMRFRGVVILTKDHAQDAIEGIIDGSGTGVSIDADSMSVDMDSFSDEIMMEAMAAGREPTTWFSEARIAGLTIVPIGAFHEAYFALGHEFEDEMTEEQIAASAAILADCGCGDTSMVAQHGTAGASFAPGTKDGPGWITHPVPTSRIRRYWVKGEGAAKIAWGTPGDFNRCRSQLAKYVQNPDWLAGLCANMHKEALGVWPGQEDGRRGRAGLIATGGIPAPILTLVDDKEPGAVTAAGSFPDAYPAEWFANPKFKTVTPLTIDRESGRIFGHLAQWGVCHIGIAGDCVKPPHSRSNYANFLKGVIDTTAGDQAVGCLTYGIGHANPRMRAAAASAHYDQMDAVVAFVNMGEDAYGIWYSGVLAPDVPDDLITKFRAVGAISGDWRPVGRYGLDLIAGVAVNTPGYPVSIAASAGQVTALIAAGMVLQPEPEQGAEAFADDNADYLATAIALALDKREAKKREQALRARAHSTRQAEIRRRIERS